MVIPIAGIEKRYHVKSAEGETISFQKIGQNHASLSVAEGQEKTLCRVRAQQHRSGRGVLLEVY